jgi:hypothetical protein
LKRRFERLAIDRCGIADPRDDEAAAFLMDLECPGCDGPIQGGRPWFCADCNTAVCPTCRKISNDYPCDHLLPTEGRASWDRASCVACGEGLRDWKCTRCLSVHCPFCGVRTWAWRGSSWALGTTTCGHLIASWNASSGAWSDVAIREDDALAGPAVSVYALEQVDTEDPADSAVAAAFGDLADLATTIQEERRASNGAAVMDTLLAAADLVSVVDVFWDDQNGMGSDTGTDYFTDDPAVRSALAALVERLSACQEQLAELDGDDRA